MAFNIYQKVFDRDGSLLEKQSRQYLDQLMQLFEQSPEGQELRSKDGDPGLTLMMIEFGMDYLGVTPPDMTPGNLREILFDLFPRKVSIAADEADEIIHALQAFWTFLQREYHLENAAACLKMLDAKAARDLKKELGNPANFGIAKSFVMKGAERGFDLSTEEGINEWMATYNAELAAGTGLRIPLPGEQSKDAQKFRSGLQQQRARGSRRRTRKRK
jgi:hypothetical protein